jgi:hypothetical protein
LPPARRSNLKDDSKTKAAESSHAWIHAVVETRPIIERRTYCWRTHGSPLLLSDGVTGRSISGRTKIFCKRGQDRQWFVSTTPQNLIRPKRWTNQSRW